MSFDARIAHSLRS